MVLQLSLGVQPGRVEDYNAVMLLSVFLASSMLAMSWSYVPLALELSGGWSTLFEYVSVYICVGPHPPYPVADSALAEGTK